MTWASVSMHSIGQRLPWWPSSLDAGVKLSDWRLGAAKLEFGFGCVRVSSRLLAGYYHGKRESARLQREDN